MDTAGTCLAMDRDTRKFYNRAPEEYRINVCQGTWRAMHEMGLYDYVEALERAWREASASEGDAASEVADKLRALKHESVDIALSASPSSRYLAVTRAKHRAMEAIEGRAGGARGRGCAGEAEAVRAARERCRELYATTWVTLITPGVQTEWI